MDVYNWGNSYVAIRSYKINYLETEQDLIGHIYMKKPSKLEGFNFHQSLFNFIPLTLIVSRNLDYQKNEIL